MQVEDGRGETRGRESVPAGEPDSKRVREVAGLLVCVLDVVGSHVDKDVAYDDPDPDFLNNGNHDKQDDGNSSDEYEPPDLEARFPTEPVYGTRSGEVLDADGVRAGRQKELDSIARHHVIEVVPNGREGKHIRGGWVEDYKGYPTVRSRFVAKEVAYDTRDDVTQSTPALLIFRLLLALVCSGFVGPPSVACFAVFDISVAFFHARLPKGTTIFVHPPKDLVERGFCWRLRRSMYGTRSASRAWGDRVREVLRKAGCVVLRTMSMMFHHPTDGYVVAVWGDDFGCIGSHTGIDRLRKVLEDNFESNVVGIIGPGQGDMVRLLYREISWDVHGFY